MENVGVKEVVGCEALRTSRSTAVAATGYAGGLWSIGVLLHYLARHERAPFGRLRAGSESNGGGGTPVELATAFLSEIRRLGASLAQNACWRSV